MAEAPKDTVQLISGLLAHMRQIVGDGACYAMLHYGAMEEGKRLGAGAGPGDLPRVLARLDGLLFHKTEIVKDDGVSVTLRIVSSPLVDGGQRAVHGVILGLVEGALTASRNGRFKGAIVQTGNELVLEVKRDA